MQRMTRQSTLELHDRLLDGDLKRLLRDRRKRGVSFTEIAIELRSRGVKISPSTASRWCRELGIAA